MPVVEERTSFSLRANTKMSTFHVVQFVYHCMSSWYKYTFCYSYFNDKHTILNIMTTLAGSTCAIKLIISISLGPLYCHRHDKPIYNDIFSHCIWAPAKANTRRSGIYQKLQVYSFVFIGRSLGLHKGITGKWQTSVTWANKLTRSRCGADLYIYVCPLRSHVWVHENLTLL